MRHSWIGLLRCLLFAGPVPGLAQLPPAKPAFTVVPLGVKGGLAEGNLSAYLVAAAGSQNFICLDAGSLRPGVEKAVAAGVFAVPADTVLRRYVRAYFISHAHLDHVAGLLLNAPNDTAKPIFGLPDCLTTLQQDYFNWRAWPNFADAGAAPALGKYALRPLQPGQETAVPGTNLRVRAFALSHARPYQSAAFLVRNADNQYLLYLGDTGADAVEPSTRLRELWQAVGPLLRGGQLRAIFIEASYPNAQPTRQLYGHLTPTLLLREMAALAEVAGEAALRGLPVVVTHLKPGANNEALIRRELEQANSLRLRLIFPEQGQRLAF